MKHAMKTRQSIGKPKRRDFGFTKFFHPEKTLQSFFSSITNSWHFSKKAQQIRSTLAYDSYNHVDSNGVRIPARRVEGIGYRPQKR